MYKRLSKKKVLLCFIFLMLLSGFLLPQHVRMPVEGATKSSYHPQSFWYYPWGKSGTHKGVDIFPQKAPIFVRLWTESWCIPGNWAWVGMS